MYGDFKEQRQQRRRERRQQISSLQIVFVSILAIGLLLAINFSARIRRSQQIEDIRQQIQATIDIELTVNADLNNELAYSESDAAVEDWAHRDGKLVRSGEKLVIPVPGATTPTPIPAPSIGEPVDTSPSVSTKSDENWHLWWSLFFEGEPPEFLN